MISDSVSPVTAISLVVDLLGKLRGKLTDFAIIPVNYLHPGQYVIAC